MGLSRGRDAKLPGTVLPIFMRETQVHGSRVVMLRGSLGPRCGRCGRNVEGKQ